MRKQKYYNFEKIRCLWKMSKIFYAKEDFIGRAFKIDEIYFNQIIKGSLWKTVVFNKVYVKLTDIIDYDKGDFRRTALY